MIRSFGNFQAAASEAALCRIFAGQYTMIDLGRPLGRHSGDFGLRHFEPALAARAEKGVLLLTGAPGQDGPAAAAQVKVEAVRRPQPPQWAVGRPVTRPHRRSNQPARVNPTLLLSVLVDGIVNVTRR